MTATANVEHSIPLGALVEILPYEDDSDNEAGIRLRVIQHHRDVDGTPLYALGIKLLRDDGLYRVDSNDGIVTGGLPLEALRVISAP